MGSHVRTPSTSMHAEPALQQSASCVQVLPSMTHVDAQENPVEPGRQKPEQHSAGMAQVAAPARHAASPAGTRHRCAPDGGGSIAHVAPGQQSGLPPHVSPSAPQVGAGWQTPRPSSDPLQLPEQQSAPEEHSSHSLRHPPPGEQRLSPPASIEHSREQQSSLPPQISPTCRVHGLWSFSLHMGRAAQCPTDWGSRTQSAVQQSKLEPQISPCTRHPSNKAQCPPVHSWPQHSGFPPQASPAGLHMADDIMQCPPAHALLQQSADAPHGLPADEQAGPAPHEPLVAASPVTTQASEQHCPAKVQGARSPAQPTGAVPSPPGASADGASG